MKVPVVSAKSFRDRATSGRNRPPIVECLAGDDSFDFFVKLRNGRETSKFSLICELLGAQIALELGLNTPDPAIVEISAEFCEALNEPEDKALFQPSIGLNFGSRQLIGYATVAPNEKLQPAERYRAAEVFAFDALVQNPDRKTLNPNLLVKGADLRLIDHEFAFSFALAIGVSDPWGREVLPHLMKDHVYLNPLRGHDLALDAFAANFKDFNKRGTLNELCSSLPDEWVAGEKEKLEMIARHFDAVEKNLGEFIDLIGRILR
jgi:hypothetical protein